MSDIELKLDGIEEKDEKLDQILKAEPEKIENRIVFSEAEEKMIDDFAKKIDLDNTNIILQYGSGAQKKISNFSEKTLDAVKDKDLGEIGKLLDTVVMDIKTMDDEEETKGPLGFFKKAGRKIDNLKVKYQSTEKNINEVSRALENHQITLMKDISMLDQMYDLNEEYYKEISMYIEAGKRKLDDLYKNDLP
uniref:toxic anion resistance protein n=1 Tax=uncultured Anaerococcus sp. TaxID=293428 RepID=UPI0028893B55